MAPGALIRLGKGTEQGLLLFRSEATARIGDRHLDHCFRTTVLFQHGAYDYGPLFGELDGVVDQVGQDLTNALGITQQVQGHIGINDGRLLQASLLRHGRQHGLHIFNQVVQVERAVLKGQFAGLNLREVENVVDDSQQGICALVDGVEVILLARGHVRAPQQLGKAKDAVERGANFVTHVGQEFRLDLTGLERFLAGHVQFDVLDLDGFQGLAQVLGGLVHVLLQFGLGVCQGRHHLAQGCFQVCQFASGVGMQGHGQVAVPDTLDCRDHVVDGQSQLPAKAQGRDHGHDDHREHDQYQGDNAFQNGDVLALAGEFNGQGGRVARVDVAADVPALTGIKSAVGVPTGIVCGEQSWAGMLLGTAIEKLQIGGAHIVFFKQRTQQRPLGLRIVGAYALQLSREALGHQLLPLGVTLLDVQQVTDQRIAAHQQCCQHGGKNRHDHQTRVQTTVCHESPGKGCE